MENDQNNADLVAETIRKNSKQIKRAKRKVQEFKQKKVSRRKFGKILAAGGIGLSMSMFSNKAAAVTNLDPQFIDSVDYQEGGSSTLSNSITGDAGTVDGNEASEMYKPVSHKFGAEGSTTTSTSYTTIASSDIAFNPDNYKVNGNLYVRMLAHLKNDTSGEDTFARIFRQNGASAVSGSEVSVTGTGFGFADTGWIDLSGDTGLDSYQIQMKVTAGTGTYNSITLLISPVKTF